MPDTLVEKLYADMPTDQLLHLLLYDNTSVTKEALSALKNELTKRGTDPEQLARQYAEEQKQLQLFEKFKADLPEEKQAQLHDLILNKIQTGASVVEIVFLLQEKEGISSGFASRLVNDVRLWCREAIYKCRSDVMFGLLFFIAGISTSVYVYKASGGTMVFIAYGFILYSFAKFIAGLAAATRQKRMKQIAKALGAPVTDKASASHQSS